MNQGSVWSQKQKIKFGLFITLVIRVMAGNSALLFIHRLSLTMILGRPKAGRALRLRLQPKHILCKKFGDLCYQNDRDVRSQYTRLTLQKIWGPLLPK